MPNVAAVLLGGGCPKGAPMSAPSASMRIHVLTESWNFDIMHRRAGGLLRPGGKHADSHKYCALGRCGTRPGPYEGGFTKDNAASRSAKITTWRKARALANRRYLEEEVYGKTTSMGRRSSAKYYK